MKLENFGKRLNQSNKMARIELIDFYKYLLKTGTIKENGAAHKRMIKLTEISDKEYRQEYLNAFMKSYRKKAALERRSEATSD